MRYRAGPAENYVVRPVDDLTLVFHRPAGMTHVVSPAVVALLDCLLDKTLPLAEIVDALRQKHDLDAGGDDVAATVAARLAEMVRLDLIDRVA